MDKKPLFSVVLIGKNEEKTLPRLMGSLAEFQGRGGEVILVDTGSTDDTVKVAEGLGCKVTSVGDRFVLTIDEAKAKAINDRFVEKGENPIVAAGDRCFDFSSARNYAATLSSCNMIATPDCDEAYTKLDIDRLNQLIFEGIEQFEYNFVYAHDQYGKEAIKFWHCKFYDRRRLHWVGIIHEVLAGAAKRLFLEEAVIKLEHWQTPNEHRGNYLRGLSIDCFDHQDNDRNSHYLAREMMWNGRPKSAIREFKRHIEMKGWVQERAESMCFLGDCYGMIGDEEQKLEWYHRAFDLDGTRRVAPMRLARHFYQKKDAQRTASYCAAALQIPWAGFYANNKSEYEHEPHEMMYWALWQLGDKAGSAEHWRKAYEFQPLNHKFLYDARWYVRLPRISVVIPTLGRPEKLQRLLVEIDKNANYPDYEVIVVEDQFPPNNQGAPKMLKKGVEQATGELVMFLGNDCVPYPDFMILAAMRDRKEFGDAMDGLVGLNDMYWHGEFATHWLASKKLLPYLDGEFFHTGYHHNGCDNELTERCMMRGKYVWAEEAKVWHDHPIHGEKSCAVDEVNKIALSWREADKALLVERSKLLGFPLRQNFRPPHVKLSAVIPVLDKLDLTKQTIESLLATTNSLGQIVIVDDGSTQDYKPYVEELKQRNVDVVYIRNDDRENVNSLNVCMDAATFPYVAMLNNDLLFSPNWDEPLLAVLEGDVWIASPYRTEGQVPADFPRGSTRAANRYGQDICGIDMSGACLMMKQETWRKIGPIDNRLRLWCRDNFMYEVVTKDFGKKVKEVASSYVHHFGSQTVASGDFAAICEKDKKTFFDIWLERGWEGVYEWPATHPVIDLRSRLTMRQLPYMKVLNVGVGEGNSGIARQLPFLRFGELTHMDVHGPYLEAAKAVQWRSKSVQYVEADAVGYHEFDKYDLVMFFDVLEHIKKEESIEMLKRAMSTSKVLIFVPLEKEFRSNVWDVKSQEHLSLWSEQDLKDLGLKTEVIKDFHVGDAAGLVRWDACWAYS